MKAGTKERRNSRRTPNRGVVRSFRFSQPHHTTPHHTLLLVKVKQDPPSDSFYELRERQIRHIFFAEHKINVNFFKRLVLCGEEHTHMCTRTHTMQEGSLLWLMTYPLLLNTKKLACACHQDKKHLQCHQHLKPGSPARQWNKRSHTPHYNASKHPETRFLKCNVMCENIVR